MDNTNSPLDIDWISLRPYFFAFSGALLALSLYSIVTRGFNYAIDFTGGTVIQVTYPEAKPLAAVREDLREAGFGDADAVSFGGGKSFALYLKGAVKGEEADIAIVEDFVKKFSAAAGPGLRVDRKEFVGPTVGRHLKSQAAKAIFFALLAIIVYVAFRFDNPLWGAAGVASIAHDVTIIAGYFSFFRIEVDLVIVAAFMTIAGYSINDTIVIFDRIRDQLRTRRGADLKDLLNESINIMRSRTLLTNAMVFMVVLALFFFGGPVIHNFALAMLLGSIIGTYSTVGLALQLIYAWQGGKRPASPAAEPASAPYKVKEGRRRK